MSTQQPAQCTEPNVAVIVVASIFGTLAVVLLVLGIIFFLLWKRRRDISKLPRTPTKTNHLTEDRDIPSPEGGLSNPAFSDGEPDLSLVEEGVGGYVRCKEYTSPEKKKSPAKTSIIDDPTKKTWTSLPKPDLPPTGPAINGSVGSFDDNFLSVDPEVTSVWLQSQDFIGLGFNIAGSMRDGIYISQVHNRGPAIESGKFKIGDRILSVTVSFENMVYEDALTILSYASPYPVKVTLQKEKVHKDRGISDTHSHLSHPLYRSQSVDTLQKIGKEPIFPPKRTFSEMKPKNDKNSQKNISNGTLQVTLEKEASFSSADKGSNNAAIMTKDAGNGQNMEFSEVTVHNVDDGKVQTDMSDLVQSSSSVQPPDVSVSFINEEASQTTESDKPEMSATAVEFAEIFDKLNEQDKLDMLRLSYEDPNAGVDNSEVIVSDETSFIESSPKPADLSVPVKPERRKKKSSSNSSVSSADESMSSPSTPRHIPPLDDVLVEDVISPATQVTAESAPQQDHEITEDIITPMKKDRNISLPTDKIEFSSVEMAEPQDVSGGSPKDISRTLVDYSLSDIESTLRPHSPKTAPPIEEDFITPTVIKKDVMAAPMRGIMLLPDTAISGDKGDNSSSSDDDKDVTQVENTTIEMEKDWTEMVLSHKTNPDLFSTPYPSRNTKEGTSGVSYNISMDELDDIEVKLRSEIKEKSSKKGVAFEVRDDVISGEMRTVDLDNKLVRPVSYTDKLSDVTHEKTFEKYRASSFKDDLRKAGKDSNDNALDWSGKRLVRSGSFTDIPQDDSVSDWIDHNAFEGSEEHLVLQQSLSNDTPSDANSNFLSKKPLTKATLFKARENLANLSDNSDSTVSVSDPSSRSSTPPPPYIANGENNGLGTSPETTPVKSPLKMSEFDSSVNINTDSLDSEMKINTDIDKPSVTTKYEGSGAYTVTVHTHQDDDTDC